MSRVMFVALLIALIIGCTSGGFVASYYLNSIWFTIAEPYVYPCKTLFGFNACVEFPHDAERGETAMWIYSWPGTNPNHIHYQPMRSCVAEFLYHDPLPAGTLRGGQQ